MTLAESVRTATPRQGFSPNSIVVEWGWGPNRWTASWSTSGFRRSFGVFLSHEVQGADGQWQKRAEPIVPPEDLIALAALLQNPPAAPIPPVVRLSIPGYPCSRCGAVMGQSLTCPGCGWVDPPCKNREPAHGTPERRVT
jgi:hypothetical protein